MLKALIVKLCVTWLMRVWSHIIEEPFFQKRTVFSPEGQQSLRGGFVLVYSYKISDTENMFEVLFFKFCEGILKIKAYVKSMCVGEYAHV